MTNNINRVSYPKNEEGNNEGKSSMLHVVNGGGGAEDARVMKLENELFDYQYNMGLLLIEKKQWAKDLEEIRQALVVTNENLKREQMAHLIALSEIEKRDQELRKAVGVEKQCVADLKKALQKMRAESAEVKYASDRKMEEAHALVLNVEDKSAELKMKLTAADNKFVEVNRISLEMKRKLKEVEARETAIRSEYHSFVAEREMHEVTLRKQKEDLQAWERLLQKREERQLESWRILNQRQDRGNENCMSLMQKLKDLEEAQRNIDTNTLNLRNKEDEKNIRPADPASKLEQIDVAKLKDDELLETNKNHNVGGTLKVQKLLNDADLQRGKIKKSSVNLQRKVVLEDKEQRESIHNEDKIGNQEYSSPGQEIKDLPDKRIQMRNEIQNLNVSEEEKHILYFLQAELQQEKDKCILQQQLLLKEREDLKQEKENFEKEWEMLDTKRDEIAEELKHASKEKKVLTKHIKKETLTNENMVTHDFIEFNALSIEKEPLGKCSENERTTLAEKAKIEYENIVHNFEVLKRELEVDFNRRKHEVENHILEQNKTLEEEKQRELENINYIRELARKEKEEIKEEWLKIKKQKTEVACNKKYIEEYQFDMKNYINNLDLIVKKLKDQRKKFVTLLVKLKNCESCGQVISERIFCDIQAFQETEDLNSIPLPRLKNRETTHAGFCADSTPTSDNTSWLRKCTSNIFRFSSLKRNENNTTHSTTKESHAPIMEIKKEASTRLYATVNMTDPLTGLDAILNRTDLSSSSNMFDMQETQLNDSAGAHIHELSQYVDTLNNKTQEGTNNVKQSKQKTGRGNPGPKGRPRVRKSQKMKDMTADSSKEEFIDVNGEIQGSFNFSDKGAKTAGRKRSYVNASKTTINEHDVDNGENQSDDFEHGGPRKRLQTVVLALETPSKRRYNFRRPKNVAKVAANRTPSFSKGKLKMKETDNDTVIGEKVCIPGIENEATTPFVKSDIMEDHCLIEKSARVEFGEENDGGNSCSISIADTEYVYEDEINNEFSGEIMHENDEDLEEDENDEDHLGMIIGMKLWNFFTT
ncbi:protein CROWDED NUCLEI 1-like isoform X1 [Papaver somniferum]|uniref:protein CROWDED NUCLEI 1-like isoform X1 n=1 Tax=Papaver somniferum TaxID=3469 RepID=UPI000E705C1E|nr:protein CROWDED NUCLEI 1-like isoform X1 [Papaver somniferum]